MKYINKLILGLLVVASVGCSDDFLETKPTNAVSPGDALTSPTSLLASLNGMHRTMYSQSPLEVGSTNYTYAGEGFIIPMLEFPASDALHTTSGNGWFRSQLKWIVHTNPNRGEVEWVWHHYYHMIGSANNIINASEDIFEDELMSSILGQAKAYRAYSYFRLVQLFANSYAWGNPSTDPGVPVMLETALPYEGKPRETVAKVYEQIEKDLTEAIAHMENAQNMPNKSHLNMNTVKGIAARVALVKGEWSKAASFANEARAGYELMGEAEYKSGFNVITGTEVMWAGDIISDQTTYYRAWFYFIGTNFNGTQNRTNPKIINTELFSQIADTDYRKDLWLPLAPNTVDGWSNDPNYNEDENSDRFWAEYDKVIETYGMTSRFETYPHMSVKFLNANPGTIDPDDVLYMRASEMYLIEAEALARSGGSDAEAAKVLFDLVSARDEAYVLSTNTGDALIEEIKLHRRIELWGEGRRWLDMLRYDEELNREGTIKDEDGNLIGTGADSGLYADGYKQDKPSVNVNWIYQIPQGEINANINMTEDDQNPSAPL